MADEHAPGGGERTPSADADTRLSPAAGSPNAGSPDAGSPDPGLGGHRNGQSAQADLAGQHAAGVPASSTPAPGLTPNGSPPSGPPPRSRWFRRGGEVAKKPRKKAPWWELPILIAVAIAVAVVIKTFLIQPFYIPSESMEKTLHGCTGCSGDRVLVNKLIFDIRDPHPGDIVVFTAPPGWDEEPTPVAPSNPIVRTIRGFGQLIGFVPPDEHDLIKRVIAVGGQSVQCCDAQGRMQVSDNGPAGPWRSLNEPYIYQDAQWDSQNRPGHIVDSADQRTFGPITIPKGRLWVMGDHRGDSADSRYHCLQEAPTTRVCSTADTTVATSAVIGKAVLIAWPPSRWRTLGTPATFKNVASAALPASLPVTGAALSVAPVFLVRRRRRRR